MNYNFEDFNRSALTRLLGIDKYKEIMIMFSDKKIKDFVNNKSKDSFQRKFNSFYRVRRDTNWRDYYYNFFEKNRDNKNITFEEILDYMYKYKNKKLIEASFCSKLLATINPDKPIWDQYVIKSLDKKVEGKTKEEKLESTKKIYKEIEEFYKEELKKENVKKLIKDFRNFFPELNSNEFKISDIKILDFILWNNRD